MCTPTPHPSLVRSSRHGLEHPRGRRRGRKYPYGFTGRDSVAHASTRRLGAPGVSPLSASKDRRPRGVTIPLPGAAEDVTERDSAHHHEMTVMPPSAAGRTIEPRPRITRLTIRRPPIPPSRPSKSENPAPPRGFLFSPNIQGRQETLDVRLTLAAAATRKLLAVAAHLH
jgi:hypothetical protein